MKHPSLEPVIAAARKRLQALHERAGPEDCQPEWMEAVWAELSDSLEELHVAAEELQQQNDELMAARDDVDSQRRNYQELFDLAPEAYLVTDALGIIRQANEAAVVLLHVRGEFLKGKPLATFIAPSDHAAFRRQLIVLAGQRDTVRWEARIQPREAPAYHAFLSASPVRDQFGAHIGLRWHLTDVSRFRSFVEGGELMSGAPKDALAPVSGRKGFLTICSFCKRVRNDQNHWLAVESYFAARIGTRFSHGLCPDCVKEHYPE
jgi:PAS domain S-box-containing protein